MAKASPIQENFSAGEISSRLLGRVNLERYKTALETCQNYIPTVQGPLVRRPGTIFVDEVKDSTKVTRLVEFEFSVTQAYILEFGDEYIRFYRDYGQIQSGGNAYEISSPYGEDDLSKLRFAQTLDVMYIVHEDYAPRKLSRTGHTSWTLEEVEFKDGPYLDTNATHIKLEPVNATTITEVVGLGPPTTIFVRAQRRAVSAVADNGSGLVEITTSADHGYKTGDSIYFIGSGAANLDDTTWTITRVSDTEFTLDDSTFSSSTFTGHAYHAFFSATDVGRHIRFLNGGDWAWGVIDEYLSPGDVAMIPYSLFTADSETLDWRLGAWSSVNGYPSVITFHEDRLVLGGVPAFPQRFDGSSVSNYETFSPTELGDSTITDANAYSFTLNSGDVNLIRWMKSDEKGMPIGTVAGEWVVRPSSSGEAITPTNVSAKKLSNFGSADLDPTQLGKAVIFPQRTKRKLRELTYFYEVDGFKAVDVTELSDHVLKSGVKELKSQKEPQPIIWAPREDGVLTSMTYSRQDTILAGWARHILGGRSDVNGTQPIVESVAVIPSTDGASYDVWLLVKRLIDGSTKRYIEYIPAFFSDEADQEDAQFLDCALTYYDPLTVSGVSLGNPTTITSTSHGLNDGDEVRFFDLIGGDELLNTTFVVADSTTHTFTLKDEDDEYVDGSLFTAYVSGGEVRKLVTTISGLDHLEGESVAVFADGVAQANRTVSSGAITLETKATIAHIGFNYISRGKTVRYETGAEDGTALGKTRRIHNVSFYMHRSINLKIGTDFDDLDRVSFAETTEDISASPELFTGIYFNSIEADYDTENQICFEQDKPYPSTILAIMPQLLTQDR